MKNSIKATAKCGLILTIMFSINGNIAWASSSGGYRSGGSYRSNKAVSHGGSARTSKYATAIKGYDPVAYFKQGKAVKGKKSINYIWHSQRWFFSSKQNERMFIKNPRKYAPQYAGFCAYAISQNALAKSNPKIFSIVDEKLYLNVSRGVKKKWEGNKREYIIQADQKWPSLEKKLP